MEAQPCRTDGSISPRLFRKNDEIEKEWKIILVDLNEETIKDEERKISLKDAVENRKGKLTIDNNMYWGNL